MRLQWTSQLLAQWYESLGIITAIAPRVSAGSQDEMGKAIPAHVHISRATDRDLGMGLRGGAATPSQALDRNRRPSFCGEEALARPCAERAGTEFTISEEIGH